MEDQMNYMPPEEQPGFEQPARRSPYADSPYMEYQAPPVIPQKKKKKSGAGKVVLAIVLALVLIFASSLVTALVINARWEEQAALQSQALNNKFAVLQEQLNSVSGSSEQPEAIPLPAGDGLTPTQVYRQNVDAVVAISCYVQEQGFYQSQSYESFGSGFILSPDGYVVSNYHVVEGATEITVTTSDDAEHKAELVGYDAGSDVAVLKIEGENFACVEIGSSDALTVGDQVIAIGNALGEMTSTLTVGYVSAKDKIVSTDGTTQNMIQTDAAINSGNSGGPLFNAYGQVVGITTAKYSGTSSSGASIEGMGFAIPMDDVMGIIEDLRDYGYVTGAYLGIYCRDVETSAQAYGLPAGAYVEETMTGYAAEKAGILAGDIIIDLGGYQINGLTELTRALRRFEAGQTTTVTVYRGGQELYLSITLDEKPVETVTQTDPAPGDEGFEDWYWDHFKDYFG